MAALLAWRYAQLLDAMPKRDTETELWQGCARALFREAGGSQGFQGSIEEAFGDLQQLQGKGEAGRGELSDVVTRRVLPSV